MDLKKLRKNINRIDERLLTLLNQRAKEAIKISKLKKKNNLSVYSPEREKDILDRLKKMNSGPFNWPDLEVIFREIMSVSRSLNTVFKISYLGPEGTFTHQAAMRKFGKKSQFLSCESINDVFDQVENRGADYGVVPIENSTEGVINYTLDMFFVSSLKICAEITLNISHSLLAKGKGKIKRIYSNPQVFAQCRKWISKNYPGVELIPTSSTAKAALQVKKEASAACIGNKILGGLYGLKTIASSIEDLHQNYTRFLVVGKKDSLPSKNDKTSILFSIKDKVGALYDVLYSFKKNKINLTKIESRPSKKKPWEYYFFVDFEGHRESKRAQEALRELGKDCIFVKVLGSYPKES